MTYTPPTPAESALPTTNVSVQYQAKTKAIRRYITWFSLANFGSALLWGSIGAILLPIHVQSLEFAQIFTGANASVDLQALTDLKAQFDAGTVTDLTATQQEQIGLLAQYNSSKASSLAMVSTVGIILTMLIQPIVGMLSDRTRSKWGRRAPYIAGGAVLGAILICVVPLAPSIAVLLILWSLAQLAVNIGIGPLTATVADRVPEDRIGLVSGLSGLVGYAAGVIGSIVAGTLFVIIGLGAYVPVAIFMALMFLGFVLFARDTSSKDMPVKKLRVSAFFTSFVTALRDRDYRWAWISKTILWAGYGLSTLYTIYMLQSYVTPALSIEQAAATAPLVAFAGIPGTLIAMFISGRWSDKIGRRKPFVIAAAMIMAVGFLVPLVWPAVGGIFAQAIIVGIGFGVFVVVDQALFVDVLPDKAAAGRDLGVSALGQNLGQAIGPVIAGLVVTLAAGNYGPVWPVAAALTFLAGLAIIPIKRVR